jgi:hypothetical protein
MERGRGLSSESVIRVFNMERFIRIIGSGLEFDIFF